jgi:hypothetical protein
MQTNSTRIVEKIQQKMAIDNTALAWNKVTKKHGVWKALLLNSVHFTSFDKAMEGTEDKIKKVAVEAGLKKFLNSLYKITE